MRAKKSRKLLSTLLAAAMTVSMLPTFASAYTDEGKYEDGPVALKKTAELQADGTYTINLEAFSTGTIKTIVERTNVPTDIVLVIDQSGSMANTMPGLPNNQYSAAAAMTNAAAYAGSYYYLVDGNYYPVTVKYASVGDVEYYTDIDGNHYIKDLVSWDWPSPKDGKVYEAYGPYLTSSLTTFTREKRSILNQYRYKASDGSWTGSYGNASKARQDVRDTYADATVHFVNIDPATGAEVYVAAKYTQLTPVYAHTYEYFYTDGDGNLVALPAIGSGNDTACPYTLYQTGTQSNGTRLDVLKYAVEKFVAGVEADAKTNGSEHRIAIVGFSSDGYNNTEILTGVTISEGNPSSNNSNSYYPDGKAHNGVQYGSSDYSAATGSALQSAITGKANIQTAIDALTAHGGTRADEGMQMAEDILYNRSDKSRESVVVFFTDGEPGTTAYSEEVAAETIKIAKELKNGFKCTSITGDGERATIDYNQPLGYTSRVYSVAVYDDADPYGTANIKGSGATRINEFMHMVSSNYPVARGEKQNGIGRDWEFFREDGSMTDGYYMVADNAAALANIFKTITDSIHQTEATVDLGSTAVLRDILTNNFMLPANYDVSRIVTQKVPYRGNNAWGTAETVNANVNISGSQINVTGFDYNANTVTNTAKDDGTFGAKLRVTIPGILAKDAAATGGDVFTNTAESGIYGMVEGELALVKAFDRPTISINRETYVLDYAKTAVLEDITATLLGVDSALDKVFNDIGAWNPSQTAAYGKLAVTDGAVVYTPTTMQWDGYDNFYVFGQDDNGAYDWTKVSVMPANNVYFEDDFEINKSGVGIVYTGTWTPIGTAAGNKEIANNIVHGGWIDGDAGLSNDTTYSDGSAHVVTLPDNKANASATFTFTGTGVDIYSRTNGTTGTILVSVVPDAATKANGGKAQHLIVDNLAASGDYYQIPTISYMSEVYGTYTVTINVTTAAAGRLTYYLDGIKVYNPLNPELLFEDEIVYNAYGEEVYAIFQEVRDLLLDANSFGDSTVTGGTGAVFIDQINNNKGNVTNSNGGTETTVVKENVVGNYEDYGPKNEVYLANGQAILFKVEEGCRVQVGLKAPAGATTALVSNGDENAAEAAVDHSTDLFYEVTPVSGADGNYVVVKNTGVNLLSITKVKFICSDAVGEVSLMMLSADEAVAVADEFDTMPVVAYSLRGTEEPDIEIEEPEVPTTPAPEEPEDEQKPEKPGKGEKPDKDQKPGKGEKPGHNNKPGKPGHNNKPNRNEKYEMAMELDKMFPGLGIWYYNNKR